jgi:signal transduction histidine kinase
VINLLENAIKYGAPGRPVTVRAGRRAGERGGTAEYVVSVHNEGPPIPEEVQHRIFDRFYRATHLSAGDGNEQLDAAEDDVLSGDGVRVGGGGGLGLAISRWIAEVHGGSVRLVRSDRSGTEFEVTLPAPHGLSAE